ncbi:MAG: hypothetical protein ACJ8ER_14045 [Allosphingosinicella sp.]
MNAPPPDFSSSDDKAHFVDLLERAEAAKRMPMKRKLTPEERLKSWEEWREIRRKNNITLGPDLTIKQLIEEGRRY